MNKKIHTALGKNDLCKEDSMFSNSIEKYKIRQHQNTKWPEIYDTPVAA